MAFLQRDIVSGEWYEIDVRGSTSWIPADLVSDGVREWCTSADRRDDDAIPAHVLEALRDYIDGDEDDIQDVQLVAGWGARLSAPGYLDCTEWEVFETEAEAEAYLAEMYGEDEDEDEDCDDE